MSAVIYENIRQLRDADRTWTIRKETELKSWLDERYRTIGAQYILAVLHLISSPEAIPEIEYNEGSDDVLTFAYHLFEKKLLTDALKAYLVKLITRRYLSDY